MIAKKSKYCETNKSSLALGGLRTIALGRRFAWPEQGVGAAPTPLAMSRQGVCRQACERQLPRRLGGAEGGVSEGAPPAGVAARGPNFANLQVSVFERDDKRDN